MEKLIETLLASVAIGMVVTAVYAFLRQAFYVPFAKKKMLEKAIADGHVIKARRIGIKNGFTQTRWQGIYQYEWKGKTYKMKGEYLDPPDEETLYFRRDPSRAEPEAQFGGMENGWKKLFLIVTVICLVFGLLFG